jgi:selenocysteine lyase/cysteine desulfurase
VDAPYSVADVVVGGGQKWVRAGWGTGFLALSDKAVDHLTPVFSGFVATDDESMPLDEVTAPSASAAAFQVTHADPVAQSRFALALEDIAEVGVPAINARLADRVSAIIDLADEFALPVTSPRAESERAGIVVIQPEPDQLTVLTASLHNHGVSATVRSGSVRLSPHVSTNDETFAVLRESFTSFASAINL